MDFLWHLAESLEPFVREYGVAAVVVILTLESLGLPLPGETLLIVAAGFAARGDISLPSLIAAAWVAAVMGDNIGYVIGRTLGRNFLLRHGARVGLNEDHFHKVEAAFAKYGPATVMFARFVNILRQLNGVVAGILGMDWRRFLLFNAIGGALWVLVWTLGVYYFSAQIKEVVQEVGLAGAVLVAGLLIVGLIYLFRRPRPGS